MRFSDVKSRCLYIHVQHTQQVKQLRVFSLGCTTGLLKETSGLCRPFLGTLQASWLFPAGWVLGELSCNPLWEANRLAQRIVPHTDREARLFREPFSDPTGAVQVAHGQLSCPRSSGRPH